ncbi:PE family protein [Mycobacterium kansasii]|uniref:PE family protein n=1 Tax=Mycobacterium kansasii TaxID=1768 RepID=A0A1V3WY17_MYCKA|nr:PE family protein [Mycobacterium kansasii]
MLAAAAGDLAAIGSTISVANAAAAAPITGVPAAGGDEVSAGIAAMFGMHAQAYQAISAQVATFHDQFVQILRTSAGSYAGTEATNAATVDVGPGAGHSGGAGGSGNAAAAGGSGSVSQAGGAGSVSQAGGKGADSGSIGSGGIGQHGGPAVRVRLISPVSAAAAGRRARQRRCGRRPARRQRRGWRPGNGNPMNHGSVNAAGRPVSTPTSTWLSRRQPRYRQRRRPGRGRRQRTTRWHGWRCRRCA